MGTVKGDSLQTALPYVECTKVSHTEVDFVFWKRAYGIHQIYYLSEKKRLSIAWLLDIS